MSNLSASGTVTTNTFTYMYAGAKFMLKQAENNDEGQLYNLISSLVYCAFTLEAYFNHLGKLRDSNWDKIERKYPKLKKYDKFCKELNLNVDANERPYVSMKNVFEFRDSMAHGKTTNEFIVGKAQVQSMPYNFSLPATNWKTFVKMNNTKRCLHDVKEIVLELHKAAGLSGNPFISSGTETWYVKN